MKTALVSLLAAVLLGTAAIVPVVSGSQPEGGSPSSISERAAESTTESVSIPSGSGADAASSESTSSSAPESMASSAPTSATSSTSEAPANSAAEPEPGLSSTTSDSPEASSASVSESAPASESVVKEEPTPDESADSISTGSEEAPQTPATEESTPVILSDDYAVLLAANQADSMMGYLGMARDAARVNPVAEFLLVDFAAETEETAYSAVWESMNVAFENLAAGGATAASCTYSEGRITIFA